MKILIVPSWYPSKENPICGSFFREQSLMLAKHGHEVVVANPCLVGANDIFVNSNKKLKIFNDEGIVTYSLNKPSYGSGRFPKLHLWLYMRNAKKIFAKLKSDGYKFDIVQAHSFWCGGVAAMLASEIFDCPFTYTEHSSAVLAGEITDYHKEIMKKLYKKAAGIICVSNGLKEAVAECCQCDGGKIRVVPNLVSDTFKRDTAIKKYSEFTFVSVGTLDSRKNTESCIRCFISAFKDTPNVKLNIIGSGNLKSHFENIIEIIDKNKQVRLLGQMTREEVCVEMNKSSAFVLASKVEPFGVVYIEAMRCGLPVIATRTAGGKEIVNEDNGLLVDIDNEQQLVDAYKNMYLNYAQWNLIEIEKQCIEMYTEDVIIEKLTNVLSEFMRGNG